METSEKFLLNCKTKIDQGVYDKDLVLPFISKEKLYNAIEKKINERLKSGSTPILTDNEIESMIKDMKESSGTAFYLFVKYGFLEKVENGYELSKKGKLAIKTALKEDLTKK